MMGLSSYFKRLQRVVGALVALGLCATAVCGGLAVAAPLDVRFEKFYEPTPAGSKITNDSMRLLMRELGLALGPRSAGPAASQGSLGVDFAYEFGVSGANGTQDYWKRAVVTPPSGLTTHGLHMRKGLPQGLQIGSSLTHLVDSNMYAIGLEMQASLVDGFRQIPDFAVRGTMHTVIGNSAVDFITGALDVSVSKSFGIAGVAALQPWLAWSPGLNFFKPNRDKIILQDKSLREDEPRFQNDLSFPQRAAVGVRVVVLRMQAGLEFTRSFSDNLNLITTRIGAVF